MDFDYSDEQRMLRESVARFAEANYSLNRLRACEATDIGWLPENWAFFAEQGWLALPFSEDAGGLGGDIEDLTVLLLEFGRAHVLEPYVSTVVICGGVLMDCRCEDALGSITSGQKTFAFAHTEAARPDDLSAVTRTVAEHDGHRIRLSGTKRVVPNGVGTSEIIVTAAGVDGPEILRVAADHPGIAITPYKLIDGSGAADIIFDGVVLEPDAVLARGNRAQMLITAAISRGALANLALAVGSIEKCLNATGRYVAERQQFGRPIGKFQALQHILAEMFVDAQDARSALYRAVAHWAEPAAEQARALASAKVMIARCGQKVSRAAIQLHGGYGMTEEFIVGHHFRRLIVLEKQWGDIDHHLQLLSGDV